MRGPECFPVSSMEQIVEANVTKRYDARMSGRPQGPITCIRSLDVAIGGFLSGGMHVIHGAPGAGKTALAYQIAGSCGCPSAFISFEMSIEELTYRLMARTSRIPLRHFKQGLVAPAVAINAWRTAVESAPDLVLVDATSAPPTVDWICTAFSQHVRKGADHGLIVLDSLHHWASYTRDTNNYFETVNTVVADCTRVSALTGVPVLAVNESNRAQGAPKGSSNIEYQSQSVLSLSVDENVTGPAGEMVIKASLTKNRDGRTGTLRLLFDGPIQRFSDGDAD